MGIVLGELAKFSTQFSEMVDSTVSDVGKKEPFANKHPQAEGGFHPPTFLVAEAQVTQGPMDFGKETGQSLRQLLCIIRLRHRLPTGEEPGDFVDGDTAGVFPRHGSSHSITDSEHKWVGPYWRFPDFSEQLNLKFSQSQGHEGILIIFSNFSPVGSTGPFQMAIRGLDFRRFH